MRCLLLVVLAAAFVATVSAGRCPVPGPHSLSKATWGTCPKNLKDGEYCQYACPSGYEQDGGQLACIDGQLRVGRPIQCHRLKFWTPSSWKMTCDRWLEHKDNTASDYQTCPSADQTTSGCTDFRDRVEKAPGSTCPSSFSKKCNPKFMHTPILLKEYSQVHLCQNDPIHYEDNFPQAAQHRPMWAHHGVYKYLPPERYNHNAEHGSIVILHHPCATQDELCQIRAMLNDMPKTESGQSLRWLLSPAKNLWTKFAVGSYEFAYYSDCLDLDLMRHFIFHRFDTAKEKVGATGQYRHDWVTDTKCGEEKPLECDTAKCKRENRNPCKPNDDICGSCVDGFKESDGMYKTCIPADMVREPAT